MIKNTLISTLIIFSSFAIGNDFSWKNLSILFASKYPYFNEQDYVVDYIKEFHPSEWQSLKNDEFQLNDASIISARN